MSEGVAYTYTRSGIVWTPQQRFSDNTAAANDSFGGSVALSDDGNTALIGAYGKSSYQGEAYVYTGSGGTFNLASEKNLTPGDGGGGDDFGWSLSLSGDGKTALIGAFNHVGPGPSNPNGYQTGSAYVFTNVGGTWGPPLELNESFNTAYDLYGYRVAISENGATIVVGAATFGDHTIPGAGVDGQGAAWVYVLSGGTFVAQGQQPIFAPDGASGDNFGVAVALSQDGRHVLIGGSTHTVGADANQGEAYDFTLSPDLAPVGPALPGGTVGTAYSQQFTATNGAGAPYSYATALTGAPPAGVIDGPAPGLTINTSSGLFSGTPTTAGSYTFLVTATDKAGGATTQTYTLIIAPGATTTTVTNLTVPYSTTAQSLTLTAAVASSPPGVTVNEGSITFAVTQGATAIGAPVANVPVVGGSASTNYSLPAGTAVGSYILTATYMPATSNPNFMTSVSTGGTLTVTADATTTTVANATAPFLATVQNVSLTATISSTTPVNEGTVTFTVSQGATTIGAPVTSGTVSSGVATASYALPANQPGGAYTITAIYNPGADFVGSTNTGTLTIGAGVIAVGPATLPNGTVGVAYSQTITATGGSATGYHFAVTSGALPAGLTLNNGTGAITGTPTAAGLSTFTVTVTDSASNMGSQQYAVTIAAGTLTLTGLAVSAPGSMGNPPTLRAGQQAQLIATATLSDGSTPDVTNQVQWSSSAPTVLSVDASGKVTGLSGGTATITASYTLNGVTKTVSIVVTVTPPTLTGIIPPGQRPTGAGVSSPAAPPAPDSRGSGAPTAPPGAITGR